MKVLISIVIAGLCVGLLSGCKDAGTEVKYLTQSISEDHSNITDPNTRWQAYNLRSYVIEQQSSCFCPYGGDVCRVYVRDNKVIDVIKKSDGKSIFAQVPQRYKTVDELFVLASSVNPDSVASLVIQYDERFGFPKLMSVDYSTQIADEEFAYYSQNIERLLN
ncbi:MAG: DUF6174 domain-containing protein [Bacteroidota bacterium]